VTDSSVDPGGGRTSTSAGLILRVKAHDPRAWERFVALYGPLVYRWCRRAGLQEADAADVGQDVFRTVSSSLGGFEPRNGEGSFRRWLWTVARSRILDFRRRDARRVPGLGGTDFQERLADLPDSALESDDDPTDEHDELALFRRAVELVMDDCKGPTREAFLRVVVEGHRPKDVARELKMTVNAVYLAKSHILRRIRDELGEVDGPS